MRLLLSTLTYLMAVSFPAFGQQAEITSLFQTELADLQGQEGVMLTVEYPPGVASDTHRHNAYVFVYVLEGSVIMQVAGGDRKTLSAGEIFYETPTDVHTVSMNASDTEPAKILVFTVKPSGTPVSIPVH